MIIFFLKDWKINWNLLSLYIVMLYFWNFSNIKKTYTSIGKINTERFEGSELTVLQCSEYLSV